MKLLATTPEDFSLFESKTSYKPSGDFKGIKAVDDEGKICGMVGFDYWTVNAAQMHVYFDNSNAMRYLVPEAFRYLFGHGKGLAITVTPAHNEASLKLQKFLGFKQMARIQDGWAIGDDMIISELRKQDCIWVRPSIEQERATGT